MSLLQSISGAASPERQEPARPHPHQLQPRLADAQPTDEQSLEGEPVSRLLEYYHSRHSAWVAEAENLAQLRDQVRSAADRETLEIVTQARKDVRDVIATARQELLVLTEQVRAALGESEPSPRAIEALKDDNWLPASATPAANTPDHTKRDEDWGAEFDSLLREADDQTLRW